MKIEPIILIEKVIQRLVPRSSWPTYQHKYRFTQDWFTRAIPHWKRWLQPLKGQKIIALEIGTYEGRSALWLLENILTHPESQIYCIDCYGEAIRDAYSNFQENLKRTKFSNKVKFFHAHSVDILPGLPIAHFDLIYLDGNHHVDAVRQDLNMCWPILKPGGYLIIDDYRWRTSTVVKEERPKGAVDNFLREKSELGEIEVLSVGYQVFLRKKSIFIS